MSSRRPTRRRLLKIGAGTVLGGGLAVGGGAGWLWAGADVNTAGKVDFSNPLAIPPLAPATRDDQGRLLFDLVAAEGEHPLRSGEPTATWGFNGAYLGPTLRAERGERVRVRVRNDLPETTSVHWHGMHLPARMDGGPHQPIAPGETWSPDWTIDQPAATLWYHPHPHGETARHVYRGLAGLFLIDDPGERQDALPNRYGIDDIPVIVQDKRLDDDNQLRESAPTMTSIGILGDTILVNGTTGPYHEVTTDRIRLRLVNASNARFYRFGLADDEFFDLVGTDGGLLPAPHRTDRIQLSPGERAEIVVRMRPGRRAVLRSYPPHLDGVNFWDRRFSGGDDTLDILQLRAADELEALPEPPDSLADPPDLTHRDAGVDRVFELSSSTINGEGMDMNRIDFAAELDATEVWEINANGGGTLHNFHVHDVQFQVLSIDDEPPPPELAGWKDTVYTPSNKPVRIALRFTDHSDPDVPYMYHCHLLRHEDRGVMGQFVVVPPGGNVGAIDHDSHDDHG